jgi:hypothetical protein
MLRSGCTAAATARLPLWPPKLPLCCHTAAAAATTAKLPPRAATATKLTAATKLPPPPLRCCAAAVAAKLPATAKLPLLPPCSCAAAAAFQAARCHKAAHCRQAAAKLPGVTFLVVWLCLVCGCVISAVLFFWWVMVLNSLTAKFVPAGTKLVLFGRYVLNIYVGIVQYILRKTKTWRAKIYLPTQRANLQKLYDIN